MSTFVFKLFDLYTKKYIQADPNNPDSVLTEEVENSLLEKILPPEAATKLSLADIEMGMNGEMVEGNHPDPENNVLLLNKGSRGLYGPPEYKKSIEPFLDPTKDYPYHRYLSNENKSLQTKDLKIWVIDDEEAISGISEVSSERARVILGDSHGKVSSKLGASLGDPTRLVQYRMLGVDTPFFSKGTFQTALQSTLDFHELDEISDLKDIDMILPTSSIKGVSKSNLPPGVHTVKVHLAAHKEGEDRSYTMRSVLGKLEGDSFSYALKQQTKEIERLNQLFGDRQELLTEFVKSLEPAKMSDPDNLEVEIDFDPERWQQCGKATYIAARHDLESGHYQLLESPVYSDYLKRFVASRARAAAELEFVKVKGAMIFCSHQLNNDEICVPDLPENETIAAIRSPIIKLQDISIVKNRHISDMYNDNGDLMQGAYICSPQAYDRIINGARNFVDEQTVSLEAAGIDVGELKALNPFEFERYKNTSPLSLEGLERQEFIEAANRWREAYNDTIVTHQADLPQLSQIRQDTFAAILAADYDGDNIAVVPQSKYPELVAGIEAAIAKNDNITEKLDKIKLQSDETLGTVLARKADPFILGKTANLAEDLQSYAVEADRIVALGTKQQRLEHLTKIAPAFYYALADPLPTERGIAESSNVLPTLRDYQIISTDARAIDPQLVARFDLYGLSKDLPRVLNFEDLPQEQIDRALELWKDLVLNLNDKIAQQNQIAVDNFKSERSVDSGFVEGVSRRFRYLNDGLKKALDENTTYYTEIPRVRNATTNRALLVENLNRNLNDFEIVPTPYSRIQHLFPEAKDLGVKQEVVSQVARYKKLYKLSRLYRDKSRIDSGPSLIFQHQGKKIEISNIIGQGHSPDSLQKLAESGGLELKIQKNTKLNANHDFYATIRIDNEWKPLGTLCNACATINDITQPIEFGRIDKFDFVTPIGTHQAEAYGAETKRIAKNFRASIPLDKVDLYAATTYGVLADTQSSTNNMGFMFEAFGDRMVDAVREFNLETIRLNSLTGATPPDGSVKLQFDRDAENPNKQAAYLLNDEQRIKLGTIDNNYFHPRPGAVVEATVDYTPPSTGVFTLPDGAEFTIGGMAKAEASGEIFNGEQIEVELAMTQPDTTPVLKLDGKVIGRINERTKEFLQSQGDLVKGKQLRVALTSEGSKFARKIKAVAPNGDLFEIIDNYKIGHQSTKERSFVDEPATLTVDFQTSKPQLAAFTFRDGKKVRLGEFNRNHRASQAKVESMGLVGKRFDASLKNNVTTLDLKIASETIDYSGVRQGTSESTEVVGTESNPTTAALLDRSVRFEPIIHYRDRSYETATGERVTLDSLDVLLDASSVEDSRQMLEELGFQKVFDSQATLESQKGFIVFTLPSDRIAADSLNRLRQHLKCNRIFDERTGGLVAKAEFDSLLSRQYSNVKVNSLLDKLPEISLETREQTSKVSLSSNVLHLLADNPSSEIALLDRYDYDWLNDKLQLDTPLSTPFDVKQYLASKGNLDRARELVRGYLTENEALAYQHLTAGTDLRYQTELSKLVGASAVDKVKGLIADGVVPSYIPNGGKMALAIPPLTTERPINYDVPLPDTIVRGIGVGIVLGNANNDLSLALGDPQDGAVKDLERPIEFEGTTYPSAEDAAVAIRSSKGFDATGEINERLLTQKLVQYPELLTQIESNGGVKWLYQNSYRSKNNFMSGNGKQSGLVRATVAAYQSAIQIVARSQSLDSDSPEISYLTPEMFRENSPAPPATISNWTGEDSLAAALSMATANARYRGNIDSDYPLNFRGNPERAPNRNLKVEKYFKAKPAGEPFVSAEDAYQHFQGGLNNDQKYELMVELLKAKLEQYPDLVTGIAQRGGSNWLKSCSYRDPNGDRFWSGSGNNSGFIKALSSAYSDLKEKVTGVESVTSVSIQDPPLQANNTSQERKPPLDIPSSKLDRFPSTPVGTSQRDKGISASIQHLDTLDSKTQDSILEHLNSMKSELNTDVSQYAKGRLNFWLGAQWNLKDKQFESSGTWNSKLWDLCKRVYPDADMALITYSGDEAAAGINLHRDDSYAAFEARSISIETVPGAETKWQMKQTYPGMNWTKEQDNAAPVTEFSLPSGAITRFNCKNPHAAFPGPGRWSINLWKVSNKEKEKYNAHIERNGMDGGGLDLGKQLPSISLPESITVSEKTKLVSPPLASGPDRISQLPDLNNTVSNSVELNAEQQKALSGLVEFATGNSEEQFAVLSGSAGTGKSFTVTRLLQEIKAKDPQLKIGFAAPTHAAVSVLNNMARSAGVKADSCKTLASTLGLQAKLNEKTGVETFEIPQGHEFKLPDVLVIDEASMIGNELYGHIREAAAVTGSKVAFMGDKIQLPPVGESISPVFVDESISSSYELKEIMRYDGDIIVTADKMREQVETVQKASSIAELEQANTNYVIPSSRDGQIVTSKSSSWEKSVIEEFIGSEFKADPNHIKVVAYTNARVKQLNQNIRTAVFGSDVPEYVPDEVMVSLATFAGPNSEGNDSQLSTSENFVIDTARKGIDRDTGYKVWQISGRSLNNVNGAGERIKTPDILVVAAESKEQHKADLKKLANQARIDRNWKPFFTLKNKYQSVDYGYAITAHRSQGSTFNKVAIDRTNFDLRLGHFNKGSNFADKKQALQEYYQLMYVALTRAKGGVTIADDARVRDIAFDREPTEANLSSKDAVNSPSTKAIQGVNFASNSKDGFAAAVTNPTENAKYKKSITRSYPVSFRDNPFRPANTNCKAEKYFKDKPAGQPFVSAEDAYQHFKVGLSNDQKFELMVEILTAKLQQYPRLSNEITKRGGQEFLAASSHQVYGKDKFWEGQGMDSGFVRALSEAYQRTLEASIASKPKDSVSLPPEVARTLKAPTPAVLDPSYLYGKNDPGFEEVPSNESSSQNGTKAKPAKAFISLAGISSSATVDEAVAAAASVEHAKLKEVVYSIFEDFTAGVDSSLRCWEDRQMRSRSNDSFIATFDGLSPEAIAYNAAKVGTELDRDRMNYFVEDRGGSDLMYVLDLPHTNLSQIRDTLDVVGISSYTLVAGEGGTKIILTDRGAKQPTEISALAKHYNRQVEIYAGSFQSITQDRYPDIIRTYEASHRDAGRGGSRQANESGFNQSDRLERGQSSVATTKLARLQAISKIDPLTLKLAGKSSRFIGFSDKSDCVISQINSAWDKDLSGLTSEDKVLIVGPTTEELSVAELKQLFKSYQPCLDEVVEAKAKVYLPSLPGMNRLVGKYLAHRGYNLKDTGKGYFQAWVKDSSRVPLRSEFRAQSIETTLKQVILANPLQQQRVDEASPIITQLINSTFSKRSFDTGKYLLAYDASLGNLTLTEKSTGSILLDAVYSSEDGNYKSNSTAVTLSNTVIGELKDELEKFSQVESVPQPSLINRFERQDGESTLSHYTSASDLER